MHAYGWNLQIRNYLFGADDVDVSSLLHRKLRKKVMHCSRSRSFKVIECDFLLVFHCNCMPVFYRLRDITIYWSVFAILSTSVSFEALRHRVWKLVAKKRVRRLSNSENRMILRLLVLSQCQRVKDERPDTPRIAKSRSSIIECDKIL